jgi:hypothetical protein
MDAHLAMLLDGDVHSRLEWELAVFTTVASATFLAIGWIITDIIRRSRLSRRISQSTIIRVGQHDEEIVEKLRNGHPFPDLVPKDKGD